MVLTAVAEGTKKLGQKITEASPEVSDKMKDAALEKTIEKGGEAAQSRIRKNSATSNEGEDSGVDDN